MQTICYIWLSLSIPTVVSIFLGDHDLYNVIIKTSLFKKEPA